MTTMLASPLEHDALLTGNEWLYAVRTKGLMSRAARLRKREFEASILALLLNGEGRAVEQIDRAVQRQLQVLTRDRKAQLVCKPRRSLVERWWGWWVKGFLRGQAGATQLFSFAEIVHESHHRTESREL